MGLGDLLVWIFRAARRADRRRAARARRNQKAAAAVYVSAVAARARAEKALAAIPAQIERRERARQAEIEKLVRTQHRDAIILARRAGNTEEAKMQIRTSTEIKAEATALRVKFEFWLKEMEAQGIVGTEASREWIKRKLAEPKQPV